jgi:hypothetical protein
VLAVLTSPTPAAIEVAVAVVAVALLAWLEYLRHDAVAASQRQLLTAWLFSVPLLLLALLLLVRRLLSFV